MGELNGHQGYQSYQSYQGYQGYQDYQGYQGYRGYQGYQGSQGYQGYHQGMSYFPVAPQGMQQSMAGTVAYPPQQHTGFAPPDGSGNDEQLQAIPIVKDDGYYSSDSDSEYEDDIEDNSEVKNNVKCKATAASCLLGFGTVTEECY
jgi:hypothetical protein